MQIELPVTSNENFQFCITCLIIINFRLGFHWPPFNTISHLHLHAISPQSEMSLISRAMFKPDSWWFVTVSKIINSLKY